MLLQILLVSSLIIGLKDLILCPIRMGYGLFYSDSID